MGTSLVPVEKAPTTGVRGMSYPAISLREAVKRAMTIWEREHKNAVPMDALAAHWGYSPASSGLRTTVAALLSFGLVAGHGSGQNRHIQLTGRALDIILETPDAPAALRDAVLSPKIYGELLSLWDPQNLPSDQAIKSHLLRNKNFNPKAVDGFVQDFRDSVGFSGLSDASTMEEPIPPGGSDMNELMAKASGIDNGPKYTAQPSPYTSVVTALAAQTPGERVRLSGDLSSGVSFRLLVSGDLTPKDVKKLIKLIEIQLEDEVDESKGNQS